MHSIPVASLIGRYPISIAMAISLHLVWAVTIIIDPSAIDATALHTLGETMGADFASAVYGSVALIALAGILVPQKWLRVLMLCPQQFVLWFSLSGAAHAMMLGTFADGTMPSEPYLGVKNQQFNVTVSIPWNKVRWINVGLIQPSTVTFTVTWQMLIDDKFTVNQTMPSL